MPQTIAIVTPTFNSEAFLDETIASVVSQPGDFELRYHIQDGGSTDRTAEIAGRWRDLINSGDYPIRCRGLVMSFDSGADSGMYAAINYGFEATRDAKPDIMGWINSDDCLAVGALSSVAAIFREMPGATVITGRPTPMTESGSVVTVHPIVTYDRTKLRAGLYDGREGRPFVQQEGTFWRSSIWKKIGGLDASFRLAGDWDLWRRMAAFADIVTVDTSLGMHRHRTGQLSGDISAYHREIDRTLESRIGDKIVPHHLAAAAREFWGLPRPRPASPRPDKPTVIIAYDYPNAGWCWRAHVPPPRRSLALRIAGRAKRELYQLLGRQPGVARAAPSVTAQPDRPPLGSYSQNFEDLLLRRAFKNKGAGTYVDVGAHDPDHLSVTKLFYEHLGWSGINIEPVPDSHRRLAARRPRDINLNVAAGAATGIIPLQQTNDPAFSSLSKEIIDGYQHEERKLDKSVTVPVRTLTDILNEHAAHRHIDFLKIDVEGWEKQVLDGMDFNRYRPSILVIEAIRPDAQPEDFHWNEAKFATWYEWEPQVLSAGYLFAWFDGLNRFYVAKERPELLAAFAVPIGPLWDSFSASGAANNASDQHEERVGQVARPSLAAT